ncbi:MAG: response regulator [Desulfuromonadaceae bacterium]|nr:response regulator [Desulfuromonadaceae bacterium]MDD2847469.1 response regulator [Desulfuromonadaceae bacterium]MDD4131418.1 response regulator [Desulfuromonadaceae bacterium]
MNGRKVVDILLVEDDAGDVELTREGLAAGKMFVNMHTVDDGIKALRYLRREEPYADAVRPDIILLDLNMPRMDGRETLKEIKSDERLRSIPVVVLTTSESETDIFKSYDLGASCYISKPVGFDDFLKVVRSLEDFWFTVVKMPSKD